MVNITFGEAMANDYTVEDLLEFLTHAGDRGLMPTATAQAFAVASRNVFGILGEEERSDLRKIDLDSVVRRFTNKRAKEFNPSSLKEYARRARRAVELYVQWRENPADFSIKTRTTNPSKKKERPSRVDQSPSTAPEEIALATEPGGYQSAFPIRPGRVVVLTNIPTDLSAAEAERLAQFIKMLPVE